MGMHKHDPLGIPAWLKNGTYTPSCNMHVAFEVTYTSLGRVAIDRNILSVIVNLKFPCFVSHFSLITYVTRMIWYLKIYPWERGTKVKGNEYVLKMHFEILFPSKPSSWHIDIYVIKSLIILIWSSGFCNLIEREREREREMYVL